MRQWIRDRLPSEERLRNQRGLRWMAPLMRRPWLWHMNRRRVALGAGIGVFFGFLIPVLQIAGAALFAVLLRANLPVAAAATLVSNPLTFAPIVLLAHRTGSAVLDEPVDSKAAEALAEAVQGSDSAQAPSWLERAKRIGKPLIVGLVVFAFVGGLLTWALVYAVWTWAVLRRRRRRRGAHL